MNPDFKLDTVLFVSSVHRTLYGLSAILPQHREWSVAQFGRHGDATNPILGIIEETGELAHAVLKGRQGIRYSQEECHQKLVDAIGDILLFSLDAFARSGGEKINFSRQWLDTELRAQLMTAAQEPTDATALPRHLAELAAKAARWLRDGTAMDTALPSIVIPVCVIACAFGVDAYEGLVGAWNEIARRDWKNNPITGGNPQ